MRVRLETGGISNQDQNRGIGVYAGQMGRRLVSAVTISEDNPDIIHNLVFKIFGSNRSDFSGRPLVITVHDLIPLKYPKAYTIGIRGRLKWYRNRLVLRRASGIITDSLASKRDIIKLTGIKAEKIDVVYLAADEVFKPGKPENKYDLPKKFVLYVGDLNWNKNVVNLTKICLELNYPLVVVGRQAIETDYDHGHIETADLVEFQRLAGINSKKIIRLGAVSNQDLAAVYNLATVYVQPSRDEGFGLPVLEAMACGCPVLSSGAGSLPEITGPAALKFNQANLRLMWQNQHKRQLLIFAGFNQAKKFSWAKTIKQTVKVYEKVITDSINH